MPLSSWLNFPLRYIQFSSVTRSCPILCNPMDWGTPGFHPSPTLRTCSNSSNELVMPSNHLILCCPLLLPSIFPSIRVFSNESVLCIRWPKYWSFILSISPSNEYSGLISFRMDWFDLLAVQGTQESSPTLQFKSINSLVLSLWSNSHIHILLLEKPWLLTMWTFVGNVMSLLFNMLSRFVIAFLQRSKHLLISWLQSPSAVILESMKRKSVTVFIISPSICHEVDGTGCHDLHFLNVVF